jgi:hypothetical protein
MDPITISAKFAAFCWYTTKYAEHPQAQEKAVLFARFKWPSFVPLAHKGLGKLLLRIGRKRSKALAKAG